MGIDANFAENLRRIRIAKKMTQAGLAEMAGVSRPRIAEFEAGKYSPSLRTVERIADALGVSAITLIRKRSGK